MAPLKNYTTENDCRIRKFIVRILKAFSWGAQVCPRYNISYMPSARDSRRSFIQSSFGNEITNLNIGHDLIINERSLFLCQVASFMRSLSPSRFVTLTATRSKLGSTTYYVWTHPWSSLCRPDVQFRLPATCTTSIVTHSSRITRPRRCFCSGSCPSTCRPTTKWVVVQSFVSTYRRLVDL